jgi:23S rRNA (pseudouridine1915-N3)-methyltransferase
MLKIKFIVVDRTRSPFLKEGEEFYLDRLKHYTRTAWIEVRSEKIRKGKTEEEILHKEGRAILQKMEKNDYSIALDRTGKQVRSKELAAWLKRLSLHRGGWVCFIIGGPIGLSGEVLSRSDRILSLSKMTLTHEMSRMFLLEQVYRAFTIMEGHHYHR